MAGDRGDHGLPPGLGPWLLLVVAFTSVVLVYSPVIVGSRSPLAREPVEPLAAFGAPRALRRPPSELGPRRFEAEVPGAPAASEIRALPAFSRPPTSGSPTEAMRRSGGFRPIGGSVPPARVGAEHPPAPLLSSPGLVLGLHLVNAALLFALLRRRGGPVGAALVGCLAWALLPRLAEAVAWSGGSHEVAGATGALAGLLLVRSVRWPVQLAAVPLLVAGAWAADSALGVMVGTLYLVGSSPQTFSGVGATTAPFWGPHRRLVVASLFGALVLVVVARLASGAAVAGPSSSLAVLARGGLVLEALGTYAVLALHPFAPWGRIGVVSEPALALGLAGASILLLAAVDLVLRRQRRSALEPRVALGWLLAFASLLPSLHLVPDAADVVAADHRLYLPAAGLALAVVPFVERREANQRVAAGAGLFLLLALGVRTALRVDEWSDAARFWVTTERQSRAADPIPRLELGRLLLDAGLADLAAPVLERALAAAPPHHPRRAWLLELAATSRLRMGDYAGAAPLLDARAALEEDPREAHLALVRLELARLDVGAARARLAALRARLPADAELAEWEEELEIATELVDRIRHPIATADPARARAFERAGRLPDAVDEWQRVLDGAQLEDDIGREGFEFLVRYAPPERARESRLDFLRHRVNEPDPELDALLVGRLAEVERWHRLTAR